MCTFGTVEMLDPFEGAAVLYYGIPTESLGGSTPEQQQFIKHCLAVIGSLHVGMGVTLLLSTRGTPELQKTVALATIIGMLLHVATCLRVRPFEGHLVDPAAMPTGALLACVTLLGVGLVVENDATDAERMNAIRIGAPTSTRRVLCAIPAQPVAQPRAVGSRAEGVQGRHDGEPGVREAARRGQGRAGSREEGQGQAQAGQGEEGRMIRWLRCSRAVPALCLRCAHKEETVRST